MRCPECNSVRQKVIDTHGAGTTHSKWSKKVTQIINQNIILRIRECLNKDCKSRFWTKEIIIDKPK